MPDLDEDESDEETPEADTTEGESPDGIEGFGMDTSDVQNEFDPKDIESLNKLIAAESEAINDYFDASKDTRDEDLRTLFSDIGHEERFHLEQLMYAKSKLTGEKYEPRDPEVKAEYEELMNGGMDEETAAYTAMDKRSMLGEDDGDDSDMEELEQESAFITDALYRNEIITSQLTSNIINNPHDISKAVYKD
jgi:rubrerythrin